MTTNGRVCLAIVCTMLCVIAGGCSTQARWVNCEGRLEPINRPAPKQGQLPSKAKEQVPR
jgi:hypothetical protein